MAFPGFTSATDPYFLSGKDFGCQHEVLSAQSQPKSEVPKSIRFHTSTYSTEK